MINLHFFASIRETLETEHEQLELPLNVKNVEDLIDLLVEQKGGVWASTLQTGSVLIAINQVVAKMNSVIKDGDEIAFFPPVTGG